MTISSRNRSSSALLLGLPALAGCTETDTDPPAFDEDFQLVTRAPLAQMVISSGDVSTVYMDNVFFHK